MQKILQQIMEDRWERERGTLDFSCDRIDLALTPGALFEGTFTVLGNGTDGAYGYISSTDRRMECLTTTFNGSQETVGYRFHGEYLENGDKVNGEFRFVTNLGEYVLPYRVKIVETEVEADAVGVTREIGNLHHFADLSRSDWEEAVRLFYSADFARLLKGSDRKYHELYRGLSERPGNQQNMEEFLIACGRKQRIGYSVREEELSVHNPPEMQELSLTICKDGWGYTGLKVSTEGEFVFTEKEFITEDDFLGNQCRISVYINNRLLHKGRNFGSVRLSGPGCDLEVPVCVMVGVKQGSCQAGKILREQLIIDIMDAYQQYRLKLIAGTTWLDRTAGLVERLVAMNDKDVTARLFQAQMLVMQERQHEAGWVLTHVRGLIDNGEDEDPAAMAYYLYLTAMVNRENEYVRKVTGQVEDIYRRNRSSWKVAWILLFLSQEYRRNASARWSFLEKQFRYGCTSPIWYLESLHTLQENPALLRRLGEYEIQVLYYGARKGVLSAELKEQLLYLAGRYREFSPVLLRLLILCYRKEKDERVLQEICAQLIRGGRVDKEAFVWYEQGVEKELRITRLYEYYMMSMDLNAGCAVSRKALMYFAWQSSLDYEHTAYLYSYLLRHKEEYMELFLQYREKIERFVADQILKEHINRDLAFLYREMVTPAMLTGQLAACLARLLFVHRIKVQGGNVSSVVVYRQDLDGVWRYPVANGVAWVAIYSPKDTILLEDTEGNRYVSGIGFTKEKMLDPELFLGAVLPYLSGEKRPEFDKYLWDRSRKQSLLDADVAERGRRLILSPVVSDFVKGRAQMRLLRYYAEAEDTRGLDAYLEEISWEVLDNVSRGEVIGTLILRGKMQKALQWLELFGPDGVSLKMLAKLCARAAEDEQEENPVITEAAIYAYRRGEYDAALLQYLSCYYNGLCEELSDIRKAALSHGVNTGLLCERLLVQIMFTGAVVEDKIAVFRDYLRQGAKEQVEASFLSLCASDYLAGVEQDELIFREIGRMHRMEEKVRTIEKLAYLKYYAEEGSAADQDQAGNLRDFMQEMIGKGIRLSFFRRISCCQDLWKTFEDKTIVECRATPGSKVTVHYVIRQEDGREDKIRTEEMTAAGGGIFFKEFVLFFGESLQYYFTKEQERQKEISQSYVIEAEDREQSGQGRFRLINEMIQNASYGEYELMDAELENMYHKDYLSSRLFTMR